MHGVTPPQTDVLLLPGAIPPRGRDGLAVGLLARFARVRRHAVGFTGPGAPAPGVPSALATLLVGRLCDAATFDKAEREAERIGASPVDVLIANGWIDEGRLVHLVAGMLALPAVERDPGWAEVRLAMLASRGSGGESGGESGGPRVPAVLVRHEGRWVRLVPVLDSMLGVRTRWPVLLAGERARPRLLATRRAYGQAVARAASRRLTTEAVSGLALRSPEASARSGAETWQAVAPVVVVGLLLGAALVWPLEVATSVLAMLTAPFIVIVGARSLALAAAFAGTPSPRARVPLEPLRRTLDRDLPVYSIMVPLFRETAVLGQLVRALTALDYPLAKLDILLVLEAADPAMLTAVERLELPGSFRVVVVPDVAPRTKPKALAYALHFARGDHVVVYDAEDVPEPDQLRRALAAFAAGPPTLGCVQAALNVHNIRAGWLARQFALEYQALFDVLLPALARVGAPVPLGGTSNHFKRDVLRGVGGWDPFNVTEDADLGIRLARAGHTVATIDATTWEEAPDRFGVWMRQRTRWLKGWMQTWLVHTRDPRRAVRELGPFGFLVFLTLIGAIVLAALVHPWVYVLILARAVRGEPAFGVGWPATAAFAVLLVGYAVTMATGALATVRRGRRNLLPAVFGMPIYWLLVSLAAYRALWQLVCDPFRWEKTEHGRHLAPRRKARRNP